ncbi:MAG: SusC/RagA family TonB-linked outer membrane protein [Flavobacteriales bacterium]|nr:SusC/RagA family TonB-linked outer membrane protein [Flavobacteriales bacterium]
MKKLYTLFITLLIPGVNILIGQTVTGTVTDENNETVPGVAVRAGERGVFTDVDGKYTLVLSAGIHTIDFTITGSKTQTKQVTLAAGEIVSLNVKLVNEVTDLDDIVVVGYGVQRKRDVTGSIETVDGRKLTQFPVPSFEAALQGQAAGVQVSQGSGLSGSSSIIRIRGIASISAGGDPLYVVDGIPITQNQFLRGNSGAMNNNPLASINPNDIESVQILKDAAATGIYGSRGANGVVLITTKRGKAKGWKFDFSTRLGFGIAATRPNMLSTEEYLAVRQEAWENDGGTGYVWLPGLSSESDAPETREAAFKQALKTNTDWVDETTGVGIKHLYSFGAAYSNNKIALYAGISYDHNGSYLIGNYYERYSDRINFDWNISDKLKLQSSLATSTGINKRVDAAWSGGLGEAMSTALPYYPVYDDSRDYGGYYLWNNGYSNPVNYRERRPWRTIENRVIGGLSLIYTPVTDLNLKLTGGYDYMDIRNYQFYPEMLNPSELFNNAELNPAWVNNWNVSATADYTKTFKEDHVVTLLVGGETQRSHTERYDRIEYYFVNSPTYENNYETDSTDKRVFTASPETWTFVSSFSRINYSYKNKYFLQAVARSDGSSKFGENSKFGFFPALSAGWIISDEDFLKENKTISFLKLRAGWGKTGNADVPGDAQYGTFSPNDNGITYNGEPIIYPIKLPNPDLKWETSSTLDASIEIRLWENTLQLEFSGYRKYSKDVLMNVSVPASTGFTGYWDNVAEILNQGIELSVTSFNIDRAFKWKTDFNIARNYNELVSIGDYTPDAVSGGTNDSRVITGKPIGSFYLMEFSHVDSENGLPVYIDLNGNETYEYDNSQRKYVGDGLPDVYGGITNNFTYKGWDLNVLATFSLGAKIFDSSGKRQMGVVTDWNMRGEIFDRWQQPGDDDVTFPRLTLDETTYSLPSGFPWWNTSLFIYDADYLRLKNISVGYNFTMKPQSSIKSIRASVAITNLFTITNFPGLDPELVRDFENAQDRNLSPNVTYLTPPQEKSYNLSINLTF